MGESVLGMLTWSHRLIVEAQIGKLGSAGSSLGLGLEKKEPRYRDWNQFDT